MDAQPQRSNEPAKHLSQSPEISVLATRVAWVQLPGKRINSFTVATDQGPKTEVMEVRVPFEANLQIAKESPQDLLGLFGLTKEPSEDMYLTLTEKDGELKAYVSSRYLTEETHYRIEEYNHEYHPAGTQFYPYGPRLTEGKWVFDTREVPFQKTITKNESTYRTIIGDCFSALYHSILESSLEGNLNATALKKHLDDSYPAAVRDANARIQTHLEEDKDVHTSHFPLDELSFPPREIQKGV